MTLSLFDCNVTLGKKLDATPLEQHTLEALKSDMKKYKIENALVSHTSSWLSTPMMGNRKLANIINGEKNLTGCWTVAPDTLGALPPANEILDEMLATNGKAVRLMPRTMNWSLADWCAGDLLNAIEARRIPTLIPDDEIEHDELHNMLSAHPKIPVVLLDCHYVKTRNIIALLNRHANLHICIGPRFNIHDALELLSEHTSLKQLIFGTRWSVSDPGATIGLLTYSRLELEELQMIASGNMLRLLKGVVV